jgi:hypothetical protein
MPAVNATEKGRRPPFTPADQKAPLGTDLEPRGPIARGWAYAAPLFRTSQNMEIVRNSPLRGRLETLFHSARERAKSLPTSWKMTSKLQMYSFAGLSGPLAFRNHVRALGIHHSAAFASDRGDQLLNMPFLPCTAANIAGFRPMARKITPSFVVELRYEPRR